MDGLIKNPHLSVRRKPIGHELLAVVIEAPVKGRGLQIQKVKRQDDPEFFDALLEVEGASAESAVSIFFALPETFRNRLWEMGVFLDPETASPPVFYSCPLEEESPAVSSNLPPLPADLVVHPSFREGRDDRVPEIFRHRASYSGRFLKDRKLIWTEDDASGMVLPYWISESMEPLMSSLRAGEPVPSLPERSVRLLTEAGIFVSKAGLKKIAWGEDFAAKKYVTMNGFFPRLHLKAIGKYFRSLIEAGWVRLGDYDSPLRYNAHNDELVFFFHDQLSLLTSRIVGRPVKASHNHLISYLPGAELRKHVDPPEHRYGISLLLEANPNPSSWPLVLYPSGPEREGVAISQFVGDAALYDACEVPHSRRGPLPAGQSSLSLLLHFVPQEDRGALEYSPFYY